MEVLLCVSMFLLGAIVASFVGVVAERAHTGHSFMRGRSKCDSCNKELGPVELVPVLSWLASFGHCRGCGSKVSVRHLLSEAALGTLFVLSYLSLGLSLPLLVFLAALSVLLFIVLYDLRHTIVPEEGWISLVLLSLVFAWLSVPLTVFGGHLLVAGVIGLFFFALYAFSKGRAMGLGDTPVAFALALLAGGNAIAGLLFSFWIGGLYGIAVLGMRRGGPKMGIEVPFVPFLAAGFLLAYFTGWNPLSF